MEPMGSQKHEINPETLEMEGMAGRLSWEPGGRRSPAPMEASEGMASTFMKEEVTEWVAF